MEETYASLSPVAWREGGRGGCLGVSCWTELQYQPKNIITGVELEFPGPDSDGFYITHPQHVGRAACGVSEPVCIPAHMQRLAKTTLTPPTRHWSHMLFWTQWWFLE